ncbi:hypothetical protein [Xanthomonas campestris]|uniref:Uncharacterized protein n=1 Tax=Pseudomonas phage vB_Pae_AM.P2 TaxID=2731695 RepID=A0A7S5W9X7_9CAUD|nr:hypothetical protein AMP2_gp064 [Pseudomonas phage vB_Pae_AM.P2]QWY17752.1 hypothetical protein [Pseudomonas phage vB_Pae-PA152]UGL60953.1 hypothetical protein [Pseudomonas phage vB_PaeS_TUMS_P6]
MKPIAELIYLGMEEAHATSNFQNMCLRLERLVFENKIIRHDLDRFEDWINAHMKGGGSILYYLLKNHPSLRDLPQLLRTNELFRNYWCNYYLWHYFDLTRRR